METHCVVQAFSLFKRRVDNVKLSNAMFVIDSMTQMLPIITIILLFIQNRNVIAESTGKLIGDFRVVGGIDSSGLPTLAFTTGSKLCAGTLIHPEYVLGNLIYSLYVNVIFSHAVLCTVYC